MALVDERAWLMRVKRGDAAAYENLVRHYQTAVFNVAYRLLGQRQEAEDAAQEAFLRAYQAMSRFDEERPFGPWIKRITANLCLNWLESARVRSQVPAADLGAMDMDHWAGAAPTPERIVMAREQEAQLRHQIWQLPPRYRVVIELRHFQELSYAEIAATLNRPLSDVKSDLFRARRQLAQALKGSI